MPGPLDYASPDVRSKVGLSRQKLRHLGKAGALLLTLAIVWYFMDRATHSFDMTLEVANQTTATIPRVVFDVKGDTVEFRNVAAGTTAKMDVTFHREGALQYTVTKADGSRWANVAASFVSDDSGWYNIGVRVKSGAIEVYEP